MTTKVQSIIHVSAGIPGIWEPTDPELAAIKASFDEAIDAGKPVSSVVTRDGVTAQVIWLDGMFMPPIDTCEAHDD